MNTASDPPLLVGRQREVQELASLVATLRAGRSAALVITGEPGVGKSTLLERLCERAAGFQIVRTSGVDTEMELAFAGLHQVCAPFLDRLNAIPRPQAQALRVAFGLSEGDPPDTFLVGLAALSLLSESARHRPLLGVVDDAQWLDRASSQILAFVARRLDAEGVALVFARRNTGGDDEFAGLPTLEVSGLTVEDSRALLQATVVGLVDEQVRDRVIAETRGNPLALVELTRGMSGPDLADGLGSSIGGELPSRVEESFRRRIEALPDDLRDLLVVAAAEPSGNPLLLWRAAEHLGIGSADPESSDGLLTVRERVVFRHPLARSAAYRLATPSVRRAAHAALAQATDRLGDPDRWAWHTAAATSGTDDEVASELHRSAGRARARGGVAAAAAFLRRAMTLTADPATRAARALLAAEASLEAGMFDATRDLLAIADGGPLDDLQRARVALVRADAEYSRVRGDDGPGLLLAAARALEPLDPVLARQTYLDAWSAALFAGPMASPETGLHSISRWAASSSSARLESPPPFAMLLDGFTAAMTVGREAAAPALQQAVDVFCGDDVSAEELLRFGWLASAAGAMVWDLSSALTVADKGVEIARRTGALRVLTVDLNVLTQLTCLAGDLAAASALVDEATAVTRAIGSQVAPFGEILYVGMRGDEDAAIPLLDANEQRAIQWGQGVTVQHTRWSRSILYNGLQKHDLAFTAARAAYEDTPQLFISSWAASELIEAAVEVGEMDVARRALEHLGVATRAANTPLARGVEARCRGLVDPQNPERHWSEAIELLSATPASPELARAHLAFGRWLRMRERTDEARNHLQVAHGLFTTCRMDAFADRARRDLAESGLRMRSPEVAPVVDLTSQEAEIAGLAASGLSNPEIGAKLFVSPRTVEWHLHKVFVKCGITSRTELKSVLAASTGISG